MEQVHCSQIQVPTTPSRKQLNTNTVVQWCRDRCSDWKL